MGCEFPQLFHEGLTLLKVEVVILLNVLAVVLEQILDALVSG